MKNTIICSRCIMDTSAANITFDHLGRCNYCSNFLIKLSRKNTVTNSNELEIFLNRIKRYGKRRDYDCIVGVSGGVDSSYALYLAVKNGLRPLAVHLDNGWNSELAVHNISNLVRKLNVDLYTHVIDWEENKDMQISFIKANVIDVEMLMDNAMIALNYKMAKQYGVKWILSGNNLSTEGMDMPSNWNWLKFDAKNIRDIHSKFGVIPIKTHPLISVFSLIWSRYIRGVLWTSFLDYFDYRKDEALAILKKEIDYRPYPYKHYESVFTRFYQGYILPQKFGVDKRKLHLSTLIMTKQMTREQALEMMKQSPYPDSIQQRDDFNFVLKKLGITEEFFEDYMKASPVSHNAFSTEKSLWDFLSRSRNKIIASK
jgi:N-acetyl sugar amidotransferase